MKRFETLSFLPKKKSFGFSAYLLKEDELGKVFFCVELVSVDKSYDSNDSHGDRKSTV